VFTPVFYWTIRSLTGRKPGKWKRKPEPEPQPLPLAAE